MSKHTAGPWSIYPLLSGSENHRGYKIESPEGPGYVLATIAPMDSDGAEGGANARLIAAAPDLLVACQAIVWARDKGGEHAAHILDENSPIMDAIRDAIAKAEKP